MSDHLKRMFDIASWVAPEEGSPARLRLDAWAEAQKKNPAFEKEIKKRYKKANAIAWAQLETGAGLPMDQLIRHFSNEYNWRNLHKGLTSMPGSFNVMEAFFRYEPVPSVFRILEERDHLLSFLEFVDFVTSGESGNPKDAIESIEEDVIYSYNLTDGPSDITFSVDAGSEFALGGVSLIRRGSELSILMLAGEKTDTAAQTENLKTDLAKTQIVQGREWLQERFESGQHEAVQLLGSKDYWQVLILSRLNIDSMTQDVRHLLWDAGASFLHLSDDIFVYLDRSGEFIKPEFEVTARKQAEKIKKYNALFEVCKSSVYLPLYYEHYADDVVDERHQTDFASSKHDLRRVKRNQLLSVKEKTLFRRVSVLRREMESKPDLISFKAPDFKVESSGFWRPLKLTEIGEDRYGQPIHGRTWVNKTLSWVQSEDTALRVSTSDSTDLRADDESSGYIYVMRLAAHPKDVFKIGLTKRGSEVRSDELSRETGALDKFLVVMDWKVLDFVTAERLIHERLDQYRVNPKREFFRAPFKTIVKTIEGVVAELQQ